MTRRPQKQHVQNYWTPKRVIRTLVWYNELAADLEAGMIRPGERPGSAAEWESGGIIERLAAQKADIDLALDKLRLPVRRAVRLYYIDGYESRRMVGKIMGCSDWQAMSLVKEGVKAIADYLCGYDGAGSDAWRALLQTTGRKKSPATPLFSEQSGVDEHEMQTTADLGNDD